MSKLIALSLFALLAVPVSANIYPMPGEETPRIQTVQWKDEETVVLTALPKTPLTVILEPGDSISRITIGDDSAWHVNVSHELDGFTIQPRVSAAPTQLLVETGSRNYEFELTTDEGLLAAYLVRFQFEEPIVEDEPTSAIQDDDTGERWSYRLRGDREVRPAAVHDNGAKTIITYAEDQSLPAVFAIGPSGDEEVVDGYMRDGEFVIDRVHQRLVFRIDKEKAIARRNKEMDEAE